jgi:flagellar motor switch protein FliN
MEGAQTTNTWMAADQAGSAFPLPPSGSLPAGATPVQWDELDGTPAVTPTAGQTTLDLRIELGRTHIQRNEVVKLRAGAVIPLDRAAGDPVDLYAGGRLIARGELLALEGSIAVRVVEVLDQTN